jgi:hypothetical protein
VGGKAAGGLSYALIRRAGDDQTVNLSALDHFEFNGVDQGSGEVSVSSGGAQDQASGLITLAGGGVWLLIAWTNAIFSGVTGSMSFRWRNNTAGANIGFDGLCLPVTSASHEHPLGVAHAILPTTGDVEVELRILAETVLTQLSESDSGGPRALAIKLA